MIVIKTVSGEDTIGSKPSTTKEDVTDNESGKISLQGSVTKGKNDV